MTDYIRCSKHPSEIISNGLFDAPCGACEAAMEDDRYDEPPTPENKIRVTFARLKKENTMSYVDAPATKMLATNCAACGKPLVDSVSVEYGIGPDCRQKYGLNDDTDQVHRATANRLVYQIALDPFAKDVATRIAALEALGFGTLATRIIKRLAKRMGIVRIDAEGSDLRVKAPYNEAFVEAMRNVPGRRWDKDTKTYVVPVGSKRALWVAMGAAFKGSQGIGPKGAFTIE